MDLGTRKLMTMHKAFYPRDDIDRLYVSRKEGGKGLASIKDSVVFVAASHQTRLDTRSKARRPIKVGIKGRGRSGRSRDSDTTTTLKRAKKDYLQQPVTTQATKEQTDKQQKLENRNFKKITV